MISLSSGWSIFHRPLLWGTIAWLVCMSLFAFSMAALIMMTNPWDGAVALKVCGGLPIVQRQDGTIWLRDRWRTYRVENLNAMECSK